MHTVSDVGALGWLSIVCLLVVFPFATAHVLPPLVRRVRWLEWSGPRSTLLAIAVQMPPTAIALLAMRSKRATLADVGLPMPGIWVRAAGSAIAVLVVVLVVARLRRSWLPLPGTGLPMASRLTMVALGIPQIVMQEFLFRGFGLVAATSALGSPVAALIASSVAFGYAHRGDFPSEISRRNLVTGLAAISLAGAALGALTLAAGSLWPAILIHWAWLAWLAVGTPSDDLARGPATAGLEGNSSAR